MGDNKENLKQRVLTMTEVFGYKSSYARNMLYALDNPKAIADETSVTIYDEDISLIHKKGFRVGSHSLTWTIYELYGQYVFSQEDHMYH